MDLRKIKKLIELIEETGVSEIEIKEGEESVRISKPTGVSFAQAPTMMVSQPVMSPPASKPEAPTTKEETALQGHVVRSPMVGTLYVSHSPDVEPFVKPGDRVKAGDVICIIEAMKTFNQIEADASGIIKARLVDNGKPVEYDQPLFLIQQD